MRDVSTASVNVTSSYTTRYFFFIYLVSSTSADETPRISSLWSQNVDDSSDDAADDDDINEAPAPVTDGVHSNDDSGIR